MVGTTISHYKVFEKIDQSGISVGQGLLSRRIRSLQQGILTSQIRRALMPSKARIAIFVALLVLMPACEVGAT